MQQYNSTTVVNHVLNGIERLSWNGAPAVLLHGFPGGELCVGLYRRFARHGAAMCRSLDTPVPPSTGRAYVCTLYACIAASLGYRGMCDIRRAGSFPPGRDLPALRTPPSELGFWHACMETGNNRKTNQS